jgi:hypothetical protein
MQMLYNSDHFAVVLFEPDAGVAAIAADGVPPRTGGYEIVDKLARKEIFLGADLAVRFREQVDALARTEPSVEEIDDFLGGFSAWMHQPLVQH